ncbi:hypothetical protein E4U54_001901 [Claviceps lovelessii]|nr:hypothetical protein E4U54_001901 [Claviceps lovelessii]
MKNMGFTGNCRGVMAEVSPSWLAGALAIPETDLLASSSSAGASLPAFTADPWLPLMHFDLRQPRTSHVPSRLNMSEKDTKSFTAAEKDKQSSNAADDNKSSNPSDKSSSTASSPDDDDYQIGVAEKVDFTVRVTPAQARQLSSSGTQAQKNRSSSVRR